MKLNGEKLQKNNLLFQKCLLFGEDGELGRKEAFENRGFTEEMVVKFEIGYCPEKVNTKLKGRLTVPIRDQYGQLLSMAGRDLVHDNPSRKWWHYSFQKSKYLYGLNHTKNDILRNGKAIIVEGYLDVVALYQHGIKNVCASMGTDLNEVQVCLLSRYCDTVYIFLDCDKAGENSAPVMKEKFDKYNIDCEVVSMSEFGGDPDDWVKNDLAKQKILSIIGGN